MKTSYSLFIISFLFLNSLMVFSQNGAVNYKYSKITLSTGEVIKARDIMLSNDNVSFALNDASAGKKMNVIYDLNKIQKIEVSSKNYFLPGILIGTGVGIITTIIVQKQIEKPRSETTTTSGPGYYQTQTTNKPWVFNISC